MNKQHKGFVYAILCFFMAIWPAYTYNQPYLVIVGGFLGWCIGHVWDLYDTAQYCKERVVHSETTIGTIIVRNNTILNRYWELLRKVTNRSCSDSLHCYSKKNVTVELGICRVGVAFAYVVGMTLCQWLHFDSLVRDMSTDPLYGYVFTLKVSALLLVMLPVYAILFFEPYQVVLKRYCTMRVIPFCVLEVVRMLWLQCICIITVPVAVVLTICAGLGVFIATCGKYMYVLMFKSAYAVVALKRVYGLDALISVCVGAVIGSSVFYCMRTYTGIDALHNLWISTLSGVLACTISYIGEWYAEKKLEYSVLGYRVVNQTFGSILSEYVHAVFGGLYRIASIALEFLLPRTFQNASTVTYSCFC